MRDYPCEPRNRVPAAMNPREIDQIGPYPVVEFLAEGGMAWVFKVEDPKFRVHRALKMLKPQAAQGDEFRRFESEAKLLARIDHPNLVTIFDLGQEFDHGVGTDLVDFARIHGGRGPGCEVRNGSRSS